MKVKLLRFIPGNCAAGFSCRTRSGAPAARLAAARAYLYGEIEGFWQTLSSGAEPTPEQAAHFYLVHAHVFGSRKKAVELVFKTRGGGAVYKRNIVEQKLQDLQTINQHVINSLRCCSAGGRLILGLPSEEILL